MSRSVTQVHSINHSAPHRLLRPSSAKPTSPDHKADLKLLGPDLDKPTLFIQTSELFHQISASIRPSSQAAHSREKQQMADSAQGQKGAQLPPIDVSELLSQVRFCAEALFYTDCCLCVRCLFS